MPESPKTSSIPSPGLGSFRLSEDLAKLQEKAREQSLSLGDVILLLDDRARTFLLLLLSLPFVQPRPFHPVWRSNRIAGDRFAGWAETVAAGSAPQNAIARHVFGAGTSGDAAPGAHYGGSITPENSFSGNQSHYATIGRSLYSRLRSSALFAIADPILQHVARDDRDNFCVFDSREGRILLRGRHSLFCHHCVVFCRDRIRRHCNGGVGLRMARAEYVRRVRSRRNTVSARILG
jgi:Exopolysaccharide synthesis, ExoD